MKHYSMMSKQAIISSSNSSKVIQNFHIQLLFTIYAVSDIMRWEAAIAEDYWHDTFKHGNNDRMEVALKTIEEK
jgi:hypothetical protein